MASATSPLLFLFFSTSCCAFLLGGVLIFFALLPTPAAAQPASGITVHEQPMHTRSVNGACNMSWPVFKLTGGSKPPGF